MTHQTKWSAMDAKRTSWHNKRDLVTPEALRLGFLGDPLATPEAMDAVEAYTDFQEARRELEDYVREHT